MAPKHQKTKSVTAVTQTQTKSSITTRRAKLKELLNASSAVKVATQPAKAASQSPTIKKFKLNTEKKPQVKGDGEKKQKKIHKCSICGKVFKGVLRESLIEWLVLI
jgi:hypothetical protein